MPIQNLEEKNIKWQYFRYILCRFDEVGSSKVGDYKVKNCNFWNGIPGTANIEQTTRPLEYLRKCRTDLHETVSVDRYMGGNDQTEINRFAVVQEC